MNAQDPKFSPSLESAFRRWREHALREGSPAEVAARENRLHSAVHALTNAGLAPAEAFLVALRRLGADDAGTRGFVRSQPGLLWEPEAVPAGRSFPGRETLAALGLAAGAAAACASAWLAAAMRGCGIEQAASRAARAAGTSGSPRARSGGSSGTRSL